MSANEPTKRARASKKSAGNDFYETMPISMGSHYVYRDDAIDKYQGATDKSDETYARTARRFAIITLVVTAIMAVVLGVLFVQGLSTINDVMPVNQTSSGSLEL